MNKPIHIAAKALTELQLSQWQELIDTLKNDGEDDPKTIAYCEFRIGHLQGVLRSFTAKDVEGRADV